MLNGSLSPPTTNDNSSNGARQEALLKNLLHDMELRIKEKDMKKEQSKKPLKYCQEIEKEQVRPETPKISPRYELLNNYDRDITTVQNTHTALVLQSLIRGRYEQQKMLKGLEQNQALIDELRIRFNVDQTADNVEDEEEVSTDGLSANTTKPQKVAMETDIPGECELEIRVQSSENDLETIPNEIKEYLIPLTEKEEQMRKVEMDVAAGLVGETLDFISKDIIRLQEEQKIVAMVKLAERVRRMREAEESGNYFKLKLGTRQKELKRRSIEDEIFRQMYEVNEETVDSYLEKIVMESVDEASTIEARQKVQEYAEKLDNIVSEIEKG